MSRSRVLAAVEPEHAVDLAWRTDRAHGLESEVRAIATCLHELANVEALFEARRHQKVCSEIRQLKSRLHSEAAEIAEHARELRVAGQ